MDIVSFLKHMSCAYSSKNMPQNYAEIHVNIPSSTCFASTDSTDRTVGVSCDSKTGIFIQSEPENVLIIKPRPSSHCIGTNTRNLVVELGDYGVAATTDIVQEDDLNLEAASDLKPNRMSTSFPSESPLFPCCW